MLALSSVQATWPEKKWGETAGGILSTAINSGDFEELIDVALAKRDVKAAAFWYKSAKELALPTEAALL